MSVEGNNQINNIFFINEDEINKNPIGAEHCNELVTNVFAKMSTYILDKDNNIVWEPDFCKYSRFMATSKRRQLAYDEIKGIGISTVFLGFDHNGDGDIPILFETMISGDSEIDSYQKRYTSYDEAMEGHKVAVELVKLELGE